MIPLLPAAELGEGESAGAPDPHGGPGLILVRRGGRVYAYDNRCPHTGAPLDWTPGHFLDATGEHILCALHGARFRIEDGACLGGPCRGEGLRPRRVREVDGRLCLDEP